MSIVLKMDRLTFHEPLQIVQADIELKADDETIIDESLCIDVGLPALLHSTVENIAPNRWADPNDWKKMPFFVCGCGDPECRAFSFVVEHLDDDRIKLTEVEETAAGEYRELGTYLVSAREYRQQIITMAEKFLKFMENKNYRPLFPDTINVIKQLLGQGSNPKS